MIKVFLLLSSLNGIQAQELRLSRTTAKNGFDFLDIYQESELVEATRAENEGIRFAAKQNIRVDKIEIHTSSYSGPNVEQQFCIQTSNQQVFPRNRAIKIPGFYKKCLVQ